MILMIFLALYWYCIYGGFELVKSTMLPLVFEIFRTQGVQQFSNFIHAKSAPKYIFKSG